MAAGMLNQAIWDLLPHRGSLYAAAQGVYRTRDGGRSWSGSDRSLSVRVFGLAAIGGDLFAITRD